MIKCSHFNNPNTNHDDYEGHEYPPSVSFNEMDVLVELFQLKAHICYIC